MDLDSAHPDLNYSVRVFFRPTEAFYTISYIGQAVPFQTDKMLRGPFRRARLDCQSKHEGIQLLDVLARQCASSRHGTVCMDGGQLVCQWLNAKFLNAWVMLCKKAK